MGVRKRWREGGSVFGTHIGPRLLTAVRNKRRTRLTWCHPGECSVLPRHRPRRCGRCRAPACIAFASGIQSNPSWHGASERVPRLVAGSLHVRHSCLLFRIRPADRRERCLLDVELEVDRRLRLSLPWVTRPNEHEEAAYSDTGDGTRQQGREEALHEARRDCQ